MFEIDIMGQIVGLKLSLVAHTVWFVATMGMFGCRDATSLAQRSNQARPSHTLGMQAWIVWPPGFDQSASMEMMFGWLHWF